MSDMFSRLAQELAAREKAAGLSMADILELPDRPRKLLTWLMRRQDVRKADALLHLGGAEAEAQTLLAELVERGFLRELEVRGDIHYRVRIRAVPGRQLPQTIWDDLSAKLDPEADR